MISSTSSSSEQIRVYKPSLPARVYQRISNDTAAAAASDHDIFKVPYRRYRWTG